METPSSSGDEPVPAPDASASGGTGPKTAPEAGAPTDVELLQESPRVRERRLALNRGDAFTNLSRVATTFWENNAKTDPEKVILVDLLTQDLRVSLRTLTLANGIRRVEGATLVGLIHPDPEWERVVWDYYDPDALVRLARSYGVSDFIDLAQLASDVLGDATMTTTVAGFPVQIGEPDLIAREYLESETQSAAKRILRLPIIDDCAIRREDYQGIVARSHASARIFSALLRELPVAALVVSHVDYSNWGFAVHAAMRAEVPVVHVQSTGGLKSYTWFPESTTPGSFRAQMTQEIGDYFERHIWPNRDTLRRAAELTTHRARSDYGRPSWWRAGQLAMQTSDERWDARTVICQRLGFDAARPIVVVFAHAMTDALGSNVEVFDDFVDWLETTARFATEHTDVQWLFLDHPAQHRYDVTDVFGALKQRFETYDHMRFMPSLRLTKHELWSLVDLVVTVRGSVSNEYPAFGIPALQAGWSEWSHCGVSTLARSRDEYEHLLRTLIGRLEPGRLGADPDVVERARLWGWFYRGLADVVSPLVPHWNLGHDERLLTSIADAMRQLEIVADPALVAIGRMWRRREAILTRLDMATADLELELGDVHEPMEPAPWGGFALNTAFERPREPLRGAVTVSSGESADLALVAGAFPGIRVIGRCDNWASSFGLSYDAEGRPFTISLLIGVDQRTDEWLQWRRPDLEPPESRTIEVWCQGRLRQVAEFTDKDRRTISFTVSAEEFPRAGLLTITVAGRGEEDSATSWANVLGVHIDTITIEQAPGEPAASGHLVDASGVALPALVPGH